MRTRAVYDRRADFSRSVFNAQASAADPSRLLGKSTRGDPGRLLREEKARKRVVKEKPKVSRAPSLSMCSSLH